MSLSKTIVVGHIGKDADIKQVNGKQVINFSVAHSENYTDAQGNKVEKTTWFSCGFWSESKVGQYLKKGMLVYVEGQVSARSYESNGKTGVSLELRVFNVNLLSAAKEELAPTPAAGAPYVAPNEKKFVDDLPF